MAQREVRVAHLARQDMQRILAWTREHFGPRQHAIYAKTIALALRALVEDDTLASASARPRDDILSGIHLLDVARPGRKGRHIIIFRIDTATNRIDVLRILHDSMDVARHIQR
ncbi:MAG TPA: type II toxin-antitoxin system RelE/ParE family toxin [Rhodanobacteraceae bacterium]